VNHPQRDTLVARGIPSSKTFISMNVPDPRIFGLGDAVAAPMPAEHFNLVYHGTMSERLGVDLVIRAVAELRDRIPGLRLHLWGDGDDRQRFEALAESLGLRGTVLFEPKGVPLTELPRRLRHMHAGIVGNRQTIAGDLMLPVKLLECVALGLPVVVPRLKTIQYYFSEDMVAYFDAGDVTSLAAAIDRVYREHQLRTRQVENARQFLGRYGWERQGTQLVAFYRTLVENER
jgi:glycosyltransferase involved in cell wall biosynthesis